MTDDRLPIAAAPYPSLSQLAEVMHTVQQGGALARALGAVLQLDAVFLTETSLAMPGLAHLVDFWSETMESFPVTYPLEGTPCDTAVRQGHLAIAERLYEAYPEDLPLASVHANGYVGLALRDAKGAVIGLLGGISLRPMAQLACIEAAFTLFSPLAASVLVRRRLERGANEHSTRFEAFHRESTDAMLNWHVQPAMPMSLSVEQQQVYLLANTKLAMANTTALQLMDVSHEAIQGQSIVEVQGLEAARTLVACWVESGFSARNVKISQLSSAGDILLWEVTSVGVFEGDYVSRVWCIQRDATHLDHYMHQLRHQATHDTLTGLPNRTALYTQLRKITRDHPQPFALGILDLDRFKEINDGLGHHAGDIVLRAIGDRIRQLCVKVPAVSAYRLGGDEFALIFAGPRSDEVLRKVCAGLLEHMCHTIDVDGLEVSVGATIGLARHPQDHDLPDELLRAADSALYFAKQRGLAIHLYTPTSASTGTIDVSLHHDIQQAVRDHSFHLNYQPKVCPHTGRLLGLEALIRWHHEGVELAPVAFMPHIERSSLIHPLTHWVLDKALEDLAKYSQASGHPYAVAINISAKNLLDEAFPRRVGEALARYGVAPHLLELELTEGVFVSSPALARAHIEALTRIGVRVSIDDFGTGFSSLAYLQSLPIHAVKIDKFFVLKCLEDERSRTIIRAIVELAHGLGLHVVAEGVEEPAMADMLADMQCDALQGYAIARPGPLERILAQCAEPSNVITDRTRRQHLPAALSAASVPLPRG